MSKDEIQIRTSASGKTAYVGDSRVRVTDIARMYEASLDELVTQRILEGLPHLTPAQVAAAVGYWRAHREEIEAEIERDEAAIRSFRTTV